jgi:basic membrane protein A and related proteins
MSRPTTRRRFVAASAGALALAACSSRNLRPPENGPVAMMLPGRIDDGGFMQSGYEGLRRIEKELGIPVNYLDGIAPERDAMIDALRAQAASNATLVIAHGGQAAEAVQRVAWEFPRQRFVSIQGNLMRPNLAIYEVRQEQSAWLAGAAAGMLTRSGTVGHLSGLRVPPGLAARAAFADGLRVTNPRARLLTTFSGSQDDVALNQRAALTQIDAGADILFTMLNAGRAGAIEACRARGVRQIGNVRDWVAAMPDVFVASAIADAGFAVFSAGRDLNDNLMRGDIAKRFGVNTPAAVRLALAENVPPDVKNRVALMTADLATGRVALPETYTGPEFTV